MRHAVASLASLALPVAALAAQQGDVANPTDPYVQTQTGMAWPARVGDAVRHQVIRYNAD